VITASLKSGFTTAVTIDVLPVDQHYLPVILHRVAEARDPPDPILPTVHHLHP